MAQSWTFWRCVVIQWLNRVFLEQHTYRHFNKNVWRFICFRVSIFFGWFNVMNRFIKTFPSWNLRWMVTIENLKNKSFRYKLWFTKANNNETYLSKLSSYDQIKGLLIVILVLNFHDLKKKIFKKFTFSGGRRRICYQKEKIEKNRNIGKL